MCDHDPNDETVLRQPAPADLRRFGWAPGDYQCVRCDDCGRVFEGAKRCIRCRSCAEKLAAGLSPSDAQSSATQQPAAPIGAQEIAEMRRSLQYIENLCNNATLTSREIVVPLQIAGQVKSVVGAAGIARAISPGILRLLDAIEALTAENQRLTDALNTTVQEATTAIDDRLKPEIERLTAKNARLTSENAAKQAALDIVWTENGHLNRIEQAAAEYMETAVALTRPHTDMDRTRVAFRNQPGAIRRLIAAVQAYKDREWYATHRAKVEADHAAAKEDEAYARVSALYEAMEADHSGPEHPKPARLARESSKGGD